MRLFAAGLPIEKKEWIYFVGMMHLPDARHRQRAPGRDARAEQAQAFDKSVSMNSFRMTTRIDKRFAALKAEGRAALVTFLMAGDPDADDVARDRQGAARARAPT